MYLHLGADVVVREDDVVGIFDLDNTTVSSHTRRFLNIREKAGKVFAIAEELPKSFILAYIKKDNRELVYLSQISSSTLRKRRKAIENPEKIK